MLHPCLLRGVAWWCLWPWRSWYLLCWYSFPGEKMHLCGSNVITLLKTWQVASKLFQNIFICLADIALQYIHLRSWFTVRMNYTLKARSPAVQQALFLWTAYLRMHIGECSCLIVCCFCIFILYVLHLSTFCAHRHTVHKTYVSFLELRSGTLCAYILRRAIYDHVCHYAITSAQLKGFKYSLDHDLCSIICNIMVFI